MNEIINPDKNKKAENLNLFSTKGVIGRKTCFIFTVLILIFNQIVEYLWNRAIASHTPFVEGVFFTLCIISIYVTVVMAIKRLKDIGWYRWLGIFGILPIFLLILSFIKSKDLTDNRQKPFLAQLKDFISTALTIIFVAGYFGLGIAQWAAVYAGAYYVLNNWFLSLLIGGFVAYIPIIGTIAGIYGAHKYWGLPLWVSILIFCTHFIIAILLTIAQFVIELIEKIKPTNNYLKKLVTNLFILQKIQESFL